MTTTTNLNYTPRRHWYDLPTPAAAAICLVLLLAIGLIVGKIRSLPSPAAEVKPVIIVASPLPQGIPPTAVPAAQVAAVLPGNVIRRALVVYGAPDLASAIGAVEAGRAFTPVARYGSDWTQVDMDGSGRVFVRTSDLYDMPDNLIDLQPSAAPVVVYQPVYAPAPAVATPEPRYEVTNEPPTPALQTLTQSADEEPLPPALLREAQDQ